MALRVAPMIDCPSVLCGGTSVPGGTVAATRATSVRADVFSSDDASLSVADSEDPPAGPCGGVPPEGASTGPPIGLVGMAPDCWPATPPALMGPVGSAGCSVHPHAFGARP